MRKARFATAGRARCPGPRLRFGQGVGKPGFPTLI